MNRTRALIVFVAVCIVLAVLLLTGIVTSIAASLVFALALLGFGFLSRPLSEMGARRSLDNFGRPFSAGKEPPPFG